MRTALLMALSAASSFAANLVVNGDFSAGNTGFTTGYTLSTQTPDVFENGINGIYAILPAGSIASSSAYGDWTNVSTDPTGGNGNVFVADGATTANTMVWSETFGVTPDTNYTFSFYGVEVSNACCSNATFVPTINGTAGTTLDTTGSWQQDSYTWNSGSSTSVTLSITDSNTSGPYNDFAITDIAFTAAATAAPEPATLALLGLSLAGVCLVRAKRNLILRSLEREKGRL